MDRTIEITIHVEADSDRFFVSSYDPESGTGSSAEEYYFSDNRARTACKLGEEILSWAELMKDEAEDD